MKSEQLNKEFNINIKLINNFLDFLIETNKKINLTAIKNKEDMLEKHIYDSLLISKIFNFDNLRVLDVGSGGGFPGIPLAILFPKSHFTLLEATRKKANYLQDAIKILNLKNVDVKCERVEECKDKEKYDVIISRALAELNIYLELVASLCKINGHIIALKGPKGLEELTSAKNAIKILNLDLFKSQYEELPISKEKRINLIFVKNGRTNNKFPRQYSLIKKRPL